ncbi:lysophospholipid acyltransferase family protein [Marinobacter sp. SS21]|uniref:lysophospholipid acyltransferase family protein n=1 Tax=Marinobacter sp. SS21 TaxID=2979460 RepID=UPI00232B0E3A|nr:lysophospholipid acyltransferase family protein [Marinobacter sp. SS21]MDC0661522.1 lysophospholipid acyltransferase family protein [Marinobacter sp. SS21]
MTSMVDRLKMAWLLFWAIALTLLLAGPVILAAMLGRTGNLAFNLTKVWAWCLLKLAGVRLEVRGREHIQPDTRYVIVSNHQSYFDPPALVLSLGLQYRWVIKQELRKIPLFGFALEASRNLFIDRSQGHEALRSIQQGVARLPPGTGVLFFPEGTRSIDGRMLPFKVGGFLVAREGGLPILPITINHSRARLPKGRPVFTPGPIEIIIHPPIEPATADQQGHSVESLDQMVERVRRIIAADFKGAL